MITLSPSDLAALERYDCDEDHGGVYVIGLYEQTQARRLCDAGLLEWLRADDRGVLYRTTDAGRAAYSKRPPIPCNIGETWVRNRVVVCRVALGAMQQTLYIQPYRPSSTKKG